MSGTSDTQPVVDTFGIALPPEWIRFPLDDDREFNELVRVQRERLEQEAKLTKTASRQFELLMRTVRADCERSNVRMVATMLNAVEVDDQDGVELLSAACTVAVLDRREMGSELPLTAATMVVAMGREPRSQDDGSEITNLEPADIVQLDAGKAVRVVRLHTFPPPEATEERPKMFAEHFLLPIDDGERAVVVSFASPTVRFAKRLSELFGKMMETFGIYGGDDPTDPTADRTADDVKDPASPA